MRRAFVIFLILLFPLNVLALSFSVSSLPEAGAAGHVASALAIDAADDGGTPERLPPGDFDPDEPPCGMDFHDTVNEEGQPAAALAPDGSIAPRVPPRFGLAPFPPIKPPPVLRCVR